MEWYSRYGQARAIIFLFSRVVTEKSALSKVRLNLSSTFGDPTLPRTWSGTTFNIYSELVRRDQCGTTFDANISESLRLVLSLLTVPFYGNLDKGRSPFRRHACAMKVAKTTQSALSNHTLHTGTLALPFLRRPPNQYHYIISDTTWNLWSSHATNMGGYSDKMIAFFDKIEGEAYAQADHIFPMGHYVKDNLINHYKVPVSKITVVGTGLGVIKPFTGEKDYSIRKVLFAAKDRFKDKGGELVIATFREVLKRDPSIKLTIVGTSGGDSFNSPNIEVLGFLPLEDLQRLFDTHSLFLMPALNEPWGLVYLEAMACKMPIMGLNRNSFPELAGHGKYGFGIDDSNPTLVADLLIKAFDDPTTLKMMGERAQTYCLSKFSWEKTVGRILSVIEGESKNV
ncbi:glycosyltransferase family 4 protein [Candidatus Cyanaurora vandensis]|uniref:glycosyltransferase family 4 protein n=1 Tax=Candidatus Cyanaurora vandensis TaxID=2714958 RepID=UPI00257F2BEA|nr:glycosyltransferase family 4 protein [Candidatus Cyanaurora vandensis]